MKTVTCHECDGDKGYYYTCCGDEMEKDPDFDICPTCMEHCGEGDYEPCESCNGLGVINETQSIEEFKKAAEKIKFAVGVHEAYKQAIRTSGMVMNTHPPRNVVRGTQYYNLEDQRIWTLNNSSWTPEPLPANHISLIRCTYKLTGCTVEEMIDADNVYELFPDPTPKYVMGNNKNSFLDMADCDLSPLRVDPTTPEQKKTMEEYQQLAWLADRNLEKDLEKDSKTFTSFVKVREGTPPKITLITNKEPQNEQTDNTTNEPLQDYSIFMP
jgi:hypothetical protein